MTSEWIKSPTARRVLLHWADARPAWLWSADGETLLWRNTSARFFHGRVKKNGVKLAPEAAPIKGQIARLIRLGSIGRPSLSRIQFLAGDRPISTTCTVTPLEVPGGGLGLLIVGVDPIEPELLGTQTLNTASESLLLPVRIANANGGSSLASFTKGLEYVYSLRGTIPIAAVNLSYAGGTRYTAPCDDESAATQAFKMAVDNLRSAGIATVVAAGNAGYRDGVERPACISSVIAVGAVFDSGSRYIDDKNFGFVGLRVLPGATMSYRLAETASLVGEVQVPIDFALSRNGGWHYAPVAGGGGEIYLGDNISAGLVMDLGADVIKEPLGVPQTRFKFALRAGLGFRFF